MGLKSRRTRAVSNAFLEAFEQIGGAKALAEWAKENPDAFYGMCSKMLPKEVSVDLDAEVVVRWADGGQTYKRPIGGEDEG